MTVPATDDPPILTPAQHGVFARFREACLATRKTGVFANTPDKWRRWSGFSDFCSSEMKVVNMDKKLVPFVLNPIQRHVVATEIRLRRAHKKPWMLILKHRKPGITTLQQVLAYWTIWREEHQECLTLAHRPDDTFMIFRMVTGLWEEQDPDHRHEKTLAALSKMEFREWRGIYMAMTAGLHGTARGQTYSRVHGSEVGWWPDLDTTHIGLAKSVGPHSALVYESTPNGQDGRGQAFYEFWQAAKAGQNDFTPVFLPWFADPRNQIKLLAPDEIDDILKADDEVRELMERNGLTKEQIKWWLGERRAIAATGRNRRAIHQEEPSDDESCFLQSVSSYYDSDLLDDAKAKCTEPLAIEENGRLKIWDVPDPDEPATYVIGADPSGGTGGDNACAVGFNLKTGRQAFTWKDNRTSPGHFGSNVLARLGKRWANPSNKTPAFLVVESNQHGHATLVGLLSIAGYDPDRTYHDTDMAKVDERGEPKVSTTPGWTHNVKSHADLTEALAIQLRDGTPRILDEDVVASIRKVSSGPNGAEFTGRDEAVANGLCMIGWPHAAAAGGFWHIGGKTFQI